ncbi:hypothetical protein GXW82_32585 [Streptacidiphilus sp. 4-A2]|nr:hypothetical protein [Streptacidiphilus sp. 4-A2]
MRKLQKVAVVVALLGSVGFAGSGTAFAGDGFGDQYQVQQSTSCKSHDMNIDVLGEVGALNGLAGNLLGGEGNPGGQASKLGSTMGCSNSAFGG